MGAIVNQELDDQDAAEITSLGEQHKCLRRYISHHVRNSLAAIMADCEGTIRRFEKGEDSEAIRNALHRILVSAEHIVEDLEKAAL